MKDRIDFNKVYQGINEKNLESMERAKDAAASYVGTFLFALNEIADSWMLEAHEELKKSPYYSHTIKKKSNTARDKMKECIANAKTKIKPEHYEFYYDFVDIATDKIKSRVENLNDAILAGLNKNKLKLAPMISKFEVARILLEISCVAYEDLFADIKSKHGFDISVGWLDAKPISALTWWSSAFDEIILRHEGKGFDLNKNEDVCRAHHEIHNYCVSGELMEETSRDAINEHSELFAEKEISEAEEDFQGRNGSGTLDERWKNRP